jgi:hypothetical protein
MPIKNKGVDTQLLTVYRTWEAYNSSGRFTGMYVYVCTHLY